MNDLTNSINLLNNAKKIVKKINENWPKTCIALSSIINRKDRKGIAKKLTETNQILKSYCRQKDINYIENANINEDCLGVKKFHLNRKGNSCFAKNLLKYLNNVWLDLDTVRHKSVQKINYYTDSRIDYSREIRQLQGNASQIPIVPIQRTNANTEKTKNSLKDSRLKHLQKVCLSHININSVRNKLEALSEFVMYASRFSCN